MKTLSERLDALIDDRDATAIGNEIARTEWRLAILKAMQAASKATPKPATKAKPSQGQNARKLSLEKADEFALKIGILLRDQGPKRRDGVRNQTGIADEFLDEVLERPWFEKDGCMWTLSSDGHLHFQRDDE